MAKYKWHKFFCDSYEIEYVSYQEQNKWIMEILPKDDSEDSLIFKNQSRNKSRNELKQYVIDILKTTEADAFYKKYKVYFLHSDITKNARENNISFHITKSINREQILTQGLIPNGNPDKEVIYASLLLDKKKPKHIPFWLNRSQCVYSYPSISNESLSSLEKDYRKNEDLWAIDITGEKCWIGSIGLGGFCLPFFEEDEATEEEYINWSTNKETLKFIKLYWENSCSWGEFVNQTEEFKRKDKHWGLEEILIPNTISSSRLFLAGSWDDKGCFNPSPRFSEILKDEFRNSFEDILNRY